MIRRNKTLVVFNSWKPAEWWIPYRTSDGRTSKECADAYALARGYCTTNGHYWNIGVNFGGISKARWYSEQTTADFKTLICTESFAPGMTPEIDNPRYTGQTIVQAIANMVADGGLDAIFTESLVPNAPPQTAKQAPDGWLIAMCMRLAANPHAFGGDRAQVTDLYSDTLHTLPNPQSNNWITNNRKTQLPYGRIGWPGCSFADIQRVAADANWGEQQNNLAKPHVVGGTNYQSGGDTAHMLRANQFFAAKLAPGNLNAFDQDKSFPNGINWAQFDGGTLTPPLSLFGLLFSRNPQWTPDWKSVLNGKTWTPMRGAWAFDWCSGSIAVGYDVLFRGGTAGILCEWEPQSYGISAVDCVAFCLLLGLSMAEAVFLSGLMLTANHSVYGAPDYAPYSQFVERRVGPAERRIH